MNMGLEILAKQRNSMSKGMEAEQSLTVLTGGKGKDFRVAGVCSVEENGQG